MRLRRILLVLEEDLEEALPDEDGEGDDYDRDEDTHTTTPKMVKILTTDVTGLYKENRILGCFNTLDFTL